MAQSAAPKDPVLQPQLGLPFRIPSNNIICVYINIYMHVYTYIYSLFLFAISSFSLWGLYYLLDMQKSGLHIHGWGMEWRGTVSKAVFDPTHDLHPQQSCKPRPLSTGAHWLRVAGHRKCFTHSFFFFLHFTQPCEWLWTLEISFGNGKNRIHTFFFREKGQRGDEKINKSYW